MAIGVALELLLLITATVHAAQGLVESRPSAVIEVDVSGGQLSVDVRDAPLAQVLRTIGDKAGIEVSLRGDVGTLVTASFAGASLEEGIRRLAGEHPVVFTYALPEGASRGEILARISVLETGSSPGSPAAVDAPSGSTPREDLLADGSREIRTLADEADRGSDVARTRLAEISASEANADLRHQAVASLGRLKGDVEPALVAALADDDASVRARAVRGLRGIATDSAMQSLADVLVRDADPRVRLAAVTALTSLPGRAMLRGLALASVDPDTLVRDTAIRGLAWWNMRAAVTP